MDQQLRDAIALRSGDGGRIEFDFFLDLYAGMHARQVLEEDAKRAAQLRSDV